MSNLLTDSRVRKSPSELKEIIRQRWPEAVKSVEREVLWRPASGIPELDALFPGNGFPKGSSIGIFGGRSSGKLSLVLFLARGLSQGGTKLLFVDCTGTFFPPAAVLAGIEPESLVVAKPPNLPLGIRLAEALTDVPDLGGMVVNAGEWLPPLPERLLRRFQAAALSRRLPVFFVGEQRNVTAEIKRNFPFVLSVQRALAVSDFHDSEAGGFSQHCFVRVKVEANKRGGIGQEVVVDLRARMSNFVSVHTGLPVGSPVSK